MPAAFSIYHCCFHSVQLLVHFPHGLEKKKQYRSRKKEEEDEIEEEEELEKMKKKKEEEKKDSVKWRDLFWPIVCVLLAAWHAATLMNACLLRTTCLLYTSPSPRDS